MNQKIDLNNTSAPKTRYWQSAPKQTKPPKRQPQTDNKPDSKLDSQVRWAIGLEVASHYGLQKEYQSRAGYAIDGYDSTFWGWIKHYPQIDIDECESLIGWLNFRSECIDRSGIRPSMFDLNTQHITNSGFGRYEVLEALNIPVNRFFEQNENRPGLKFGGELYAFVSTRTGFFNAKPRTPQWDATSGKYRKYESARKKEGEEGNKVFYPNVDQIACDLLMKNYPICKDVTPDNYWDVVLANPAIPISTTEGAKKAISLTGYGFPCVAVFGVCNWSVGGSPTRQLLPELATLAKGGRSMPIAYDMDDPNDKIKAFLNGRAEARKYRAALLQAGADPKLTRGLFWDRKLGKGIDDAIATLRDGGEDVSQWIANTIAYSRHRGIYAQTSETYQPDPNRQIERTTTGDYLPGGIIVRPGSTTALIADTGSGKTHQIGAAVRSALSKGLFAIVISPTNALGQQTAANLGLPHRHSRQSIDDLIDRARSDKGIVMCPDSLYLVPLIVGTKKYIVVLDEAAKVLEHITTGATLKDRYSSTNLSFKRLLVEAESIIIAEAKLGEQDLLTIEQISGKPTLVYEHKKLTAKREIKKYTGAAQVVTAALTNDLLADLRQGQKALICCDSQRQAEKLERIINDYYPDKRGIRIDSTTAWMPEVDEALTFPNLYLAKNQPDWMIYTSITKAGWDLTGFDIDAYGVKHDYHFDRIYAFLNVLSTSDHVQMIGRYRPNIPVSIACPPLISTTGDESILSNKALKQLRDDSVEAAIKSTKVKRDAPLALQQIINDLYVRNAVRNGLEKSIANYAIGQRLIDDGHTVTDLPISMADLKLNNPELHLRLRTIGNEMSAIGVAIDREWGDYIASIKLTLADDAKEAIRLDRLESPSPYQRAKVAKIRLCGRFSGVDFDNATTAYYSTRKYGKLSKGADRHAKLSFIDVVSAAQLNSNTSLLCEPIVAAHHLSVEVQQINLIRALGVVDLLAGEYSKSSPQMLALHQKCLELHRECQILLGLNFSVKDGKIGVYSRLVSRFGLSLVPRRDGAGKRERYYQVATHALLLDRIDKLTDRKEEAISLALIPTAKAESVEKIDRSIDRLVDKLEELGVRDLLYSGAIARLEASSKALDKLPNALVDAKDTKTEAQSDYGQKELNLPPDLPDWRII